MQSLFSQIVWIGSLMVLVITAALWVRSVYVLDLVSIRHDNVVYDYDHWFTCHTYNAQSTDGALTVWFAHTEERDGGGPSGWSIVHELRVDQAWFLSERSTQVGSWRRRWGGFAIGSEVYVGMAGSMQVRYVTAPIWPVAIAVATFTLVIARRRAKRKSQRVGWASPTTDLC